MDYNKVTIYECFIAYHDEKIACECDADNKKINIYVED